VRLACAPGLGAPVEVTRLPVFWPLESAGASYSAASLESSGADPNVIQMLPDEWRHRSNSKSLTISLGSSLCVQSMADAREMMAREAEKTGVITAALHLEALQSQARFETSHMAQPGAKLKTATSSSELAPRGRAGLRVPRFFWPNHHSHHWDIVDRRQPGAARQAFGRRGANLEGT